MSQDPLKTCRVPRLLLPGLTHQPLTVPFLHSHLLPRSFTSYRVCQVSRAGFLFCTRLSTTEAPFLLNSNTAQSVQIIPFFYNGKLDLKLPLSIHLRARWPRRQRKGWEASARKGANRERQLQQVTSSSTAGR